MRLPLLQQIVERMSTGVYAAQTTFGGIALLVFCKISNCVGKRSRHAHSEEGKCETGCNGHGKRNGYESGEEEKDRVLSDCDPMLNSES